jgi:hypothetical protein
VLIKIEARIPKGDPVQQATAVSLLAMGAG